MKTSHLPLFAAAILAASCTSSSPPKEKTAASPRDTTIADEPTRPSSLVAPIDAFLSPLKR